jgi:hypothetical protein
MSIYASTRLGKAHIALSDSASQAEAVSKNRLRRE